jgi:uncharacterized protein
MVTQFPPSENAASGVADQRGQERGVVPGVEECRLRHKATSQEPTSQPPPSARQTSLWAVHPNERLLRQEYKARASSDDASLADVFADDVVWHVPGRSAISGVYRGKKQVMAYVRRRRRLAGGTFKITVEDVLANDEIGLVIARGSAVLGGKTREWRAHGFYRFRDGQIAECWVLPEDQYVFDQIWS